MARRGGAWPPRGSRGSSCAASAAVGSSPARCGHRVGSTGRDHRASLEVLRARDQTHPGVAGAEHQSPGEVERVRGPRPEVGEGDVARVEQLGREERARGVSGDHLRGALDVEDPVAAVEHLQRVVVEPVLALVVDRAPGWWRSGTRRARRRRSASTLVRWSRSKPSQARGKETSGAFARANPALRAAPTEDPGREITVTWSGRAAAQDCSLASESSRRAAVDHHDLQVLEGEGLSLDARHERVEPSRVVVHGAHQRDARGGSGAHARSLLGWVSGSGRGRHRVTRGVRQRASKLLRGRPR